MDGLVLSRNVGQGVMVDFRGERLEVRVVGVWGSKIRLQFIAPRSIAIVREELDGVPVKAVPA